MRYFLIILFIILLTQQATIARSNDSLKNNLADTTSIYQLAKKQLDTAEFYSLSNIKKSINLAENGLDKALLIKHDSLIAAFRTLLGRNYTKIGSYGDALLYLDLALSHFDSTNNKQGQIATLKIIGDLSWYTGKFNEALVYYEQYGKYADSVNDTKSLIRSFISKGAVYGNINKLDTAIIIFKKANQLAKINNDKYLENLSKFNIGDALLFSGNPKEAISVFSELLNEVNKDKSKFFNIAGLYSSMANAYLEIDDIEKAQHNNKIALKFAQENGILREESEYYALQFKIDSTLHNYKQALYDHLKFKELTDRLNSSQYKENLANFEIVYDLKKRKIEIEKLRIKNEISQNQLRRNRYYFVSIAIVIILLLTLIRNIFLSRKRLNVKNKKLDEQKEELESTLKQLKQTQAQLVQSEKMASLGTLTSGVAHEINNPLNFINGGIHILETAKQELENENLEEAKRKYELALKMISDGLKKSSSIVKSLMTFATRENSVLEEHAINTMIKHTLQFLNPYLEGITVVRDFSEEDKINVYPDKLHQVFLNILDNAIKAVKANQNVDKIIKIRTQKDNTHFKITIENHGKKIPKNSLNKVFDPFYTTRSPGEGVGMGLTISYNLIKEHNGMLKAQNTEYGVAFIIELPLQ